MLDGRGYVLPEDVKAIAPDALRHRVVPSYEAEADDIGVEVIIERILDAVTNPKEFSVSGLTPEELRELRRIHVLAGRRVDSLLAGDYRSAVRGRGMEFEEVRVYVPGDDIRHIDWNVTARAGEPFVKVFREERQMTVQLVVDISA